MGERLTKGRAITLRLDGRAVWAGRDETCDIVLGGVGVSRRHAQIVLDPAAPEIIDSGSSFGVRVNGASVTRAKLREGDEVTIGVARFQTTLTPQSLTLLPLYEQLSAPAQNGGTDRTVRIGRDPDSDIQCLHPLVSRRHAILETHVAGTVVVDCQSANGTFVNGRAVKRAELAEGDIVQVGPYRFFAEKGRLVRADDYNRVRIEALGLTVRRGKRTVLDNVSLTVEPGQFVAILGPSGAGKSTLAGALTGQVRPQAGDVYLNAMPLRQFASAFSSTIGFVAQHDLLPAELTVAEVFAEQSLLRLPADSTRAERERRIDEVIGLLELAHVRGTQVRRLSGGEAKRVHLGIELLAAPALIFLDEPLAGLDFGLIRSFMKLFRAICDRGHTVLLTTHTLEQIESCDRIFFVNKGSLVYQGRPADMGPAFAVESIAEVYEKVKRDNITRTTEHTPAPVPVDSGVRRQVRVMRVRRTGAAPLWRQCAVLLARSWRVLVRDGRNLALVGFQAPIIALLLGLVFRFDTGFFPLSFYFAVTVAVVWIGGVNTVREFAREWPMARREHRAGLSASAYAGSKLAFFGVLTAVQGVVFAGCLALLFTNLKVGWEMAALCALACAGGGVLGLCVSALSAGVSRAVSLLPLVFIPQIFFAGALAPFDRMSALGRALSRLTVSRPVFALFKRFCVLEQGLGDKGEWLGLATVAVAMIALTFAAVALRLKTAHE